MKNIAITANTSWYVYNFRKNTIIALIAGGYNVFVVSPRDECSQKLIDIGCNFINLSLDARGLNPFNEIKTILHFLAIFKSNSIKCVLNFTPKNNIYGTISASLLNIAVINNIAGLGTLFVGETFTSKVARLLYKLSQKRAEVVFFQNKEDKQMFIENKYVLDNNAVLLPGSGVDLERFQLSIAPNDNVVRFLLVARLLYEKGILHYVEAAKILKEKYSESVEFNLLGFFDENSSASVKKNELEKWVSEGSVNYLGSTNTVQDFIAKHDCIVLPSYYREGVPRSLLEAAAMGKPLITTDNIGCRETVDHELNGYLCEPRSTPSLVFFLEKMINKTHEERLSMGLESRNKMIKDFDEKIVIEKYLDSISKIFKNI